MPGATLPELFAAQVARTPEADAVVFEDERLSYGELDARSSRLAHHLRALGVGPEVVVGLCIERSLAMLVGLVGILKAGGAYLPLDPDYPPERLAFMLADAGAPVLLTRAALRAHLPAHDAQVVCLDADWPAIARQPATAPVTNLAPQHPAYVIYTSGSTGTPKGVMVDHASLANKVLTLGQDFGAAPGFRTAALEFVCSLILRSNKSRCRWCMALRSSSSAMQFETRRHQFWRHLARQKVDLLNCTPSLLESIVESAPADASLRHLVLGGEAFPRELQRQISRHVRVANLTNFYGPTETTIDAVGFTVDAEQPGPHLPIGRPLPNYRAYVLDGGLGACACWCER